MSRKSVVLPRGLVALRPKSLQAEESVASEPAATEPAPRAAIPAIDLKAVQRKAYERGFSHAIEEKGGAYDAATAALQSAAAALHAARSQDESALADFAVRLACSIAQEVVVATIESEAHDVRGMVRRVLQEALPDLGGGEVTLEGHPEDLALLPNDMRQGATLVHPQPDSSLPRGSFRVVGGDAEFYSGIWDRFEAIQGRMLSEVGHDPA